MDGTTPSVSSVSDGSNPGIALMDGYNGFRGDLNGLQVWTGTLPQTPQTNIPAAQLVANLAPQIRASEAAVTTQTRGGSSAANSERVAIAMSSINSMGSSFTGGDPSATAALQTLETEVADGSQVVEQPRQKPNISGPKLTVDLNSGPKFSIT